MTGRRWRVRLSRWMPGLSELLAYPRSAWRQDLAAGLSVAAVALPVGVAYAQLAGFSPVAGLYSSMLPMVVYALFGSSRQLIVGPDAATCAMISATLIPLAAGNAALYQSLAISLTLFTGLFCLLASRFRLGFLADFLSRPILAGLLNGVAINIIIGQLGKVSGLSLTGKDAIGQLLSLYRQWSSASLVTLGVSAFTLLIYAWVARRWPRSPAALVAMVAATALSWGMDLSRYGVSLVGVVQAGFPPLRWPAMPHEALGTLVPAAAALALISFSSAMLTGRSFAAKNGYDIDADREFRALGVANVVSAMSQGFAISGADSRTAVNDAAGGQTRMVSLVAAAAILVVLLLFTPVLAWLPIASLGAILVASAIGLMNLPGLLLLRRIDRAEFHIGLITLVGVLLIGVMPGIVLAVTLALLRFLLKVSRPADHLLGRMPGSDGFYELTDYPNARSVPGLMLFRFESPLIFFNADYFRRRVLELVERADEPVRWVVIDALSIGDVDYTGALAVGELCKALAEKGVVLAMAGRMGEFMSRMSTHGVTPDQTGLRFFPNRSAALAAFHMEVGAGD
ncbi:SulP family inorganic anion transporter [Microvirgula aerodenitrificans]|uniref:SulP family inorganic anion transporter n=1 Tax=Microvirgula aerodenitrificans TaxID=57480 RepID=UPI002F3E867A